VIKEGGETESGLTLSVPSAGSTFSIFFKLRIAGGWVIIALHGVPLVDEPGKVYVINLPSALDFTYHFTLAHSASSMNVKKMRWMLPRVRIAKATRTIKRVANVPSTASRKVGLNEDPGSRIVPKNELN